jgi:hypothetical protein
MITGTDSDNQYLMTGPGGGKLQVVSDMLMIIFSPQRCCQNAVTVVSMTQHSLLLLKQPFG